MFINLKLHAGLGFFVVFMNLVWFLLNKYSMLGKLNSKEVSTHDYWSAQGN